MTPDLVQQFGPRLVTALTVALIFAALWTTNRERYLLAWAGAWTIWTTRYATALLVGPGTTTSALLPALALATATLTLWGARALTRAPLPRAWICKSVRDESGAWERLENYISRRTNALLSHGICQTCLAEHYPEHR